MLKPADKMSKRKLEAKYTSCESFPRENESFITSSEACIPETKSPHDGKGMKESSNHSTECVGRNISLHQPNPPYLVKTDCTRGRNWSFEYSATQGNAVECIAKFL